MSPDVRHEVRDLNPYVRDWCANAATLFGVILLVAAVCSMAAAVSVLFKSEQVWGVTPSGQVSSVRPFDDRAVEKVLSQPAARQIVEGMR